MSRKTGFLKSLLLSGLAAGLACPAIAQSETSAPNTPSAEIATRDTPGVIPPGISERPNCLAKYYPLAAAREHQQGTVQLKMIIGVDGMPHDVTVEQSSGHPLLDAAAVKCVQTWRYKPAMKDGSPVEIYARPSITYAIR